MTLKYGTQVETHIIHETLATKDVGEEARGILDVRATFGTDHLLPILVVHGAKVLSNRAAADHDTASHHQLLMHFWIGDKRADALNLRALGMPR